MGMYVCEECIKAANLAVDSPLLGVPFGVCEIHAHLCNNYDRRQTWFVPLLPRPFCMTPEEAYTHVLSLL